MTLRGTVKSYAILVITIGSVIGATTTLAKPSAKHKMAKAQSTKSQPEIHHDANDLPIRVREMRQWIIEAARSGDIEELGPVLESNELPPLVSFDGTPEPIGFWKTKSRDGHGREILAVMLEIFEMGYVKLRDGTSEEIYVWPYLAEVPFGTLAPAQIVDLHRLVPADREKDMLKAKRYSHYRAAISKDGTWQYFTADD